MRLRYLCLVLALGGCQSTENVWLRTDGRRTTSDPKLSQQFDIDTAVCDGEAAKANMSGFADGGLLPALERRRSSETVVKGCMAQRGYLLVPRTVAEAKVRS